MHPTDYSKCGFPLDCILHTIVCVNKTVYISTRIMRLKPFFLPSQSTTIPIPDHRRVSAHHVCKHIMGEPCLDPRTTGRALPHPASPALGEPCTQSTAALCGEPWTITAGMVVCGGSVGGVRRGGGRGRDGKTAPVGTLPAGELCTGLWAER